MTGALNQVSQTGHLSRALRKKPHFPRLAYRVPLTIAKEELKASKAF